MTQPSRRVFGEGCSLCLKASVSRAFMLASMPRLRVLGVYPAGAEGTVENMETTNVTLWATDLRARLVDTGYDPGRVDELITSNLERFRTSKLREFVPLLVERSVQRALEGD
jgi:hypothetical protein